MLVLGDHIRIPCVFFTFLPVIPLPSSGQHNCGRNTTSATTSLPPCPLLLSLLSLLTKPTVDEAKKYYPLFGLGANMALIFFGQSVRFVASLCANLPSGIDPWGIFIKYLMAKTTPQANPTRAWSPIPSHVK